MSSSVPNNEYKYSIRLDLNTFIYKNDDTNINLEICGINKLNESETTEEQETQTPFKIIQSLSRILNNTKYYKYNDVFSFDIDICSTFRIELDDYYEVYDILEPVEKIRIKLKDKEINRILGTSFKKFNENTIKDSDKCSICLEEYKLKEGYRTLECCTSTFHKKCIDKWFKTHRLNCPLCRHHFE